MSNPQPSRTMKGKGAPVTGRTTSPPAPRQREASNPQPARAQAGVGGGPASSAASILGKPSRWVGEGRAGGYSSGGAGYAGWDEARGHVPRAPQPVNVEHHMQQMITNAATKEQFETGSEEPPPAISCVAFDSTGNHLAYGDRAGRCYVFSKTPGGSGDEQTSGYNLIDVVEAYQPQLDTLNSTVIEAKVNVIHFVNMGNGALFFLTANDKTIKLWKVWERMHSYVDQEYQPVDAILDDWTTLKMPSLTQAKPSIWHKEMKVFAADHEYHVNSITSSSNGENFITSDDLTVQLWHLGHSERSLRVLDRRPEQMEELSETITASSYHSSSPQEFCVANSKGFVALYDLRTNLVCGNAAKVLSTPPRTNDPNYLETILAGISSVKYTPCGTYVVARDYLTTKVWDVRKGILPVRTLRVHDKVQPRLNELYEHDYVFDRFEVVTSPSGQEIYTGSYRSEFVQFDANNSSKLYTTSTSAPTAPICDPAGKGAAVRPEAYEDLDFQHKTLHLAHHPEEHTLAVSCGHELFLYAHQT